MFFRALDGLYTQEVFAQLTQVMQAQLYLAIIEEKAVGAVIVHDWNRTARACSIGLMIDEKFQDRGYCFPIIKEIITYLVNSKNLQKISFNCSSEDKKIIHLLEKNKVKKEGEFERAAWIDGKYVTTVEYAFFAERLKEYE